MKTILRLIYRWYKRKKELEDMQSYIWSELMREDNCNWEAIKHRPKRVLMIQYSLSPKWNKCDVWYCLEQFFVLRRQNDEMKRDLGKKLATIEELTKQLEHYRDLNQNQ